MKYLVPRSLLARSVLLIAAILIISQIAWIQFYRMNSARSQSEQLASSIARVLNTVSLALETMNAASRRKFTERLPSDLNIRLLPGTAWDTDEIAVPQPELLNAIRQELAETSGGHTEALAVLEEPDRSIWVKIAVKQRAYWVAFSPDAFGSHSARAWVGWSVVSFGLALIGGLALMLRVNRPLRALARAAATVAEGGTPDTLTERGPSEIKTLAQAFNRMTRSLQQQEANRAVLLAGVSHDLRTPLSRLRLALEMSREQLPAAVTDGMEQDIEDMDAIVNQFLDFAREGSSESTQKQANLNEIVQGLAARYEKRGEPVHVKLQSVPPIDLKPLAVQRMLTNLVENSLRYGMGAVEIETSSKDNIAIVSVMDRGPGIPAQEMDRVMQPFTRLEAARSDTTGAGLGLAIVDRIARMHGGSVQLSPRQGGGLEARVELPLTSRELEQAA